MVAYLAGAGTTSPVRALLQSAGGRTDDVAVDRPGKGTGDHADDAGKQPAGEKPWRPPPDRPGAPGQPSRLESKAAPGGRPESATDGEPPDSARPGSAGEDEKQERADSRDDHPFETYKKALKTTSKRLFRGDTRTPDEIFGVGDGFHARGTSGDLKAHAELEKPSRYIPTSRSAKAAMDFTVSKGGRGKLHGWVYEIESPEPAIDVNKALGWRYRFMLWGQSEKEMAFVDHIPREHIKCAREVNGLSFTGKVVENPHFRGR